MFEVRVADGAILRHNAAERNVESVTYVGDVIDTMHTARVCDFGAANVAP